MEEGGGIDGQIHKKGGYKYKDAHQELKKRYHSQYISGHAALTENVSFAEKSIDSVIVVAGLQGSTDLQKENNLYSCYYNSLVLAGSQRKISIAFPSISTGIFCFPLDKAASISLKAIYDFMNEYRNTTIRDISIHFLRGDPNGPLKIYQNAAISCAMNH